MHAERIIVKTDGAGRLNGLPPLPPRTRVEAILLILEECQDRPVRTPVPELAALTRVCGDLVSPAAEPEDWNALHDSA